MFQRFATTRASASRSEDDEVGPGESLSIVERDPVTIDRGGRTEAGWTRPAAFEVNDPKPLERTGKAHERARGFVQLLIDACGGVNGAFSQLEKRLTPKGAWFVLLTVQHEWGTRSLLHEAVSRVAPDAGADNPALRVLELLTDKCKAWHVEIDRLERESDTRGTPLHLAAAVGSLRAVRMLVDAGAGVWTTARGKYPLDCAHPYDKDAADSADVAPYLADAMRGKQPPTAHQSVVGARCLPAHAQARIRPSAMPRADALRSEDDTAFREGSAARCEAALSRRRRVNAPPDEVTTPVEPVGPPVAQMPDDEMQMLDTDDMADIMKDPDSAIFSAAEAVEELERSPPLKKSKPSSSSAGAYPAPTSPDYSD